MKLSGARIALLLLAPLVGAGVTLAVLLLRDRGPDIATPVTGQPGPPPTIQEELQAARDFQDFPLYWLGETFGTLPLTRVTRSEQPTPYGGPGPFGSQWTFVPRWGFLYGTCDVSQEEGCSPPVEVQISPLCAPAPFWLGLKDDELPEFRGARAFWRDYAGDGFIWTGNVVIHVFARRDLIIEVANALTPLGNVAVPQAGPQLPPPALQTCPSRAPEPPPSLEGVEGAQQFKGFPLYWVGDSFASYPLTSVDHLDLPTLNEWYFGYGESPTDGVPMPVVVEISPLCQRPSSSVGLDEVTDVFPYRGGKAMWVGEARLRIWTGEVVVTVHTGTQELTQQAAEALTPFGNVPVPGPPGDLPPPNLEQCPPSAWLPSP